MKKSELRKIIRNIIIQEQGPRPSMNKEIPQEDMSWLGNPTNAQEAINNYTYLYNNSGAGLQSQSDLTPQKFIDDIKDAERKGLPWWWPVVRYGPTVVRWVGGLGALLWDNSPDDDEVDDMQVYSPTTAAPMRRGAVMNEQAMKGGFTSADYSMIYQQNQELMRKNSCPATMPKVDSQKLNEAAVAAMVVAGTLFCIGLAFYLWDNSPDDPDVDDMPVFDNPKGRGLNPIAQND